MYYKRNPIALKRPVSGKKFSEALGLTMFAVLLVAILSGVRLYFGSPYVSTLGLVVIAVALAPSVYYYLNGFSKPIPLIELNCFFYALTFGLPALSKVGFRKRPTDALMIEALLLTLSGLVALLAGYHLAKRGPLKAVRSLRFPAPTTYRELEKFGWACESAYILWYFYTRLGGAGIGSVDQFTVLLGWVGKTALVWLFLNRNLSKHGRLVFIFGLVPFEIIRALATSLLAQFLNLALLFMVVFLYAKKRLPVKWIVLSLLVFIFFSPVKYEYRRLAWFSGEKLGTMHGTLRFVEMATDYWTSPMQHRLDDITNPLTRRTDHVGLLAAVMEMTPSVVPYAHGETLLPLTYYWIPRIIWPGKPEARLGNVWAKWYGFLDPSDNVTSFNLPWLVEFYLNFGVYGVLICMFLTGGIFFLVERLFARAQDEIVPFCAGLGICLTLWYAESNFALMWGNTPVKIIILLIFSRVFFRKRLSNHT